MSAVLFERIEDFITDAGLGTGYEFKFDRWTDTEIEGKTPFILIKRAGSGGTGDRYVRQIDVVILLVDVPTNVETADARAQAIQELFMGSSAPTGVLVVQPLAELIGPMSLENGRQVWQLNIRCFV